MPTPAYGGYGPTPHVFPPTVPDQNQGQTSSSNGNISTDVSPSAMVEQSGFRNQGSAPFSNLPPPAMPLQSQSQSGSIVPPQMENGQTKGASSYPTSSSYPSNPNDLSNMQLPQSASVPSNNILPDNAFFNLFWPNWPASLPSPKLVYSLCDIFFSKKWLCEGIVNKERFFKGLACPPHHPSFPHVSLLHAMCAIATKFVAPDGELSPQPQTLSRGGERLTYALLRRIAYGLDRETYWKSDPSPTDYHAAVNNFRPSIV